MNLYDYIKKIIEIYHNQYYFALLTLLREIEPNVAKSDEENIMQITENSIFGN